MSVNFARVEEERERESFHCGYKRAGESFNEFWSKGCRFGLAGDAKGLYSGKCKQRLFLNKFCLVARNDMGALAEDYI